MKTWNIGNTTVRNPSRIRDGLAVLSAGFAGCQWTAEAEEEFFGALVEAGVYVLSGAPLAGTSAGQGGRKWASAFNQLGFARAWRRTGAVEITPVGQALLGAESEDEINEVFLRQLLKYHLPSAIEHDGKFAGFDIAPFWLFLRIMAALAQSNERGLSKEEIGLFIVTTIRDGDDDRVLEEIRAYRAERDALVGRVAKGRYDGLRRRQKVESLYAAEAKAKYGALERARDTALSTPEGIDSPEVLSLLDLVIATGKGSRTQRALRLRAALLDGLRGGASQDDLWQLASDTWATTKGRSLFDYADTAVRYFALSGLFSIAGSRVVLRENSLAFAEQLLAQGESPYDEQHYLEEFYDPSLPILPSDDVSFLLAQYRSMRGRLGVSKSEDDGLEARELKRRLSELRSQLAERQENDFYLRQAESLPDIERFFEEIEDGSLLGGSAYRPAFYEWNIWRCFLAVNEITCPISETRGFKIDEEIYPVHHAAGGQPDMMFRYRHGVLVVEATLSTGENQWAQEQEPVQRHVKSVMVSNPDVHVVGIFVAPKIDMNTAINFRRAMGWFGDAGERRLDIIPVTTDQLRGLMRRFEHEGFRSDQMFNLFLRMLDLRDEVDTAAAWLQAIDQAIRAEVIV